jgi:hypothetical protein
MRLVFAFLLGLALTSPAAAYVGPGAGLGTIGTVVALAAALLLLVVGFIWYPIRRLLRRGKAARAATRDQQG